MLPPHIGARNQSGKFAAWYARRYAEVGGPPGKADLPKTDSRALERKEFSAVQAEPALALEIAA